MSVNLSTQEKEKLYEYGSEGLKLKDSLAWSSKLQFQLNLKALLAKDNAKELIPSLPAQIVYQTIKANGQEESLELIRNLSSEQ